MQLHNINAYHKKHTHKKIFKNRCFGNTLYVNALRNHFEIIMKIHIYFKTSDFL